jgi:hypothetical protein
VNSSISSSEIGATDRSARRFLIAFAATLPALFAALAVLAYVNYDKLPAPWISESMAFNEKARWLDRHLTSGVATDVLVIGSSMALNNISGPTIQGDLGVHNVVNTGSWGLTTESTRMMFGELLRHIRPNLVVLPVYHGDFRAAPPMEIEWPDFARSLGDGHEASLYLHNPDVWYYIKSYIDLKEGRALGRTSSTSLDFDTTGGVSLDCFNFHRSEARWNHFKSETFQVNDISSAALASVGEMARMARDKHIAFWVVVCPMRPEAERTLSLEIRLALWQQVREQVESCGGVFIAKPSSLVLSDADFADYIHLNECGAKTFTAAWLREGRSRNPGLFP